MATILYDAEVFRYNWMFGFKIIETREVIQIWDDFSAIRKFIDDHKDDFFIGFNSVYYDDIILETVLKKVNPFDISCRLVDDHEQMYARLKLHRMDIMEGMAVGTSLKSIESEMGMSIEETEVDFLIDRPLTEEEIARTNKYNNHDLDATERLLNHRWSNFVKTKMDLIKYFKLPASMMRKPFATMVATGLGAKRTNHPPRHFEWSPSLRISNPDIQKFLLEEEFLTNQLIFEIDGVEHTMGLGGMHGARETYQGKRFWKVDVKGYYSLIQMEHNLLSRSLPPEGKQKYRDLYDDRLERKRLKDPSSDSLKAAILAVWGATLNQYQLLSDITTGNLIMVTGQAFIVDLLEKLEGHMTLIQTNTDGIFIDPYEGEEELCKAIIDEWVTRTGFQVEFDYGVKIFQKDVNNYVCMYDTGEVTAKGGYVNLWKMQDDPKFFEFRLTYNQSQGTVMDKAVVKYFMYDIPVEDTINAEMNPKSFQFTVKKGARTYSHVELHTREISTNQTKISKLGKVNRVFASKDTEFERHIYKIKNGNLNIFPNMDINVFIFNKDLSEWTDEEWRILDRDYYIQRAKERISDFITPRPKKEKKTKATVIKLKVYQTGVDENNEKVMELSIAEITRRIFKSPNGLMRIGDMKVNHIGEWFTFVEKKGKTTVLHMGSIHEDMFDVSAGKLRNKKIKIDNKHYFEVIERTLDAIVIYTDKKDSEECFEFEAESFEEALNKLNELGLLDEEIKVEEPEVKKITTSKSKEIFTLDENNYISYEAYNMGEGTTYEADWFRNGKSIKRLDSFDASTVLSTIEKWIIEYSN